MTELWHNMDKAIKAIIVTLILFFGPFIWIWMSDIETVYKIVTSVSGFGYVASFIYLIMYAFEAFDD